MAYHSKLKGLHNGGDLYFFFSEPPSVSMDIKRKFQMMIFNRFTTLIKKCKYHVLRTANHSSTISRLRHSSFAVFTGVCDTCVTVSSEKNLCRDLREVEVSFNDACEFKTPNYARWIIKLKLLNCRPYKISDHVDTTKSCEFS